MEFAGYGSPFETPDIEGAADVDGADMHELVKLLAQCEPVKFDEIVACRASTGFSTISWATVAN